jgi:uncharacterized membrane protein YgcG
MAKSPTDDGSEDKQLERQEKRARLQMQQMESEPESIWARMKTAEDLQKTASTTITAAVRRHFAGYAYAFKKIDKVPEEDAGRAAEFLASGLGLCVLSSEEQAQLPCIAPFIERLESKRYVCRACVPGRSNEEHDRAFCALKDQEGGESFFAWHGSPFKNWPSIIADGLRVMSDTPEMLHGAMHGAGIYFAQKADQSLTYSMGHHPLHVPKLYIQADQEQDLRCSSSLLGLFEVAGNAAKTASFGSCDETRGWVVQDAMKVQLRLVLVINYVPNTRVAETLASLASEDSDILPPRAQKVGYGAVPVGFGGYPMAYGAALFSPFQTQKRTAQEIEDTTWVSIDAADSRLVEHMRILLARQEQQKKIVLGTFVSVDEDSSVQWQTEILQDKNALGTFVSADEDSPVQWQTQILQNRVEDLETVLAEKNTKINSLQEETKDLQGKLMGALRRLADYEGGGSSSKRPRESSPEPSWSRRDRSHSCERSRGRQGSRSQKVAYAGGSSSGGGGSSVWLQGPRQVWWSLDRESV